MPDRRLDDRIRQLCRKVTESYRERGRHTDETELVLQELMSAIHEKVERIRCLAASKLLHGTGQKDHPQSTDRRNWPS